MSSTNTTLYAITNGEQWMTKTGDWAPFNINTDDPNVTAFITKADLARQFLLNALGVERKPRGVDVVKLDPAQIQVLAGAADMEPVPGAEVAPYVEAEDTTVYDGELVDDDDLDQLAATANRHYADFESAGHSALVAAWNCGAALARAKELVAHGEFKDWVESNFSGSYSLASTYMRIAANVQRSALSEHDSINGVLKAISEARKGGRAGTPERDFQARLTGIAKASKKLADAIEEFADDLGNSEDYSSGDWEALTNKAVLPIALAMSALDTLWGVA